MKKSYRVLGAWGIVSVGLLAGCSSNPPEKPPVKEYAAVPLYMAGQEIPGADQEKYLYHGSVKMYSVGRLVDPGSGTMREAGTVYRVESAPQWNLIPQYDADPESFARNAMRQQYADALEGQMLRTVAVTREMKEELDAARDELRQTREKCAELEQAKTELLKQIGKDREDNKLAVQNMRLMQRYIQKLEQRINDLKIQSFGGRK